MSGSRLMGPPDENRILGSDPAVLSSPSFKCNRHYSTMHVSHPITSWRSNATVVSCLVISRSLSPFIFRKFVHKWWPIIAILLIGWWEINIILFYSKIVLFLKHKCQITPITELRLSPELYSPLRSVYPQAGPIPKARFTVPLSSLKILSPESDLPLTFAYPQAKPIKKKILILTWSLFPELDLPFNFTYLQIKPTL